MLGVVKFASVVVKTVDVLIVDEIVDMAKGSPVVAVLSSGTTLLYTCMMHVIQSSYYRLQAIPVRVITIIDSVLLTPAQLTALTCTRCSPLEFSVKVATVSVVITGSDMLTEIW